ncbi:hypothetical protein D3C75_998760 [compost metagenome]
MLPGFVRSAVYQSRGHVQQVVNVDFPADRHQIAVFLEHLVFETRNIAADRIEQINIPPLEQHHDGSGGNRFRHRI